MCCKTEAFRKKVAAECISSGRNAQEAAPLALSVLWRVELCIHFPTIGRKVKFQWHQEELTSTTMPLFLGKGKGKEETANVGPGAWQCPVRGKQQHKPQAFSLEHPGNSC